MRGRNPAKTPPPSVIPDLIRDPVSLVLAVVVVVGAASHAARPLRTRAITWRHLLLWKVEGREKAEMAGVRVLASPHPHQPTDRPGWRTKNRQPARTTPKPTGRPGRAPKTGNQRAPSSGATSLFQDPPFLDKYAGNKKITMARVAVTRPAVSPSNARKPVVVFGLCLCLWRHPMAPAGVAAPRSRTRCGGEDCPSRRGRISCGPPSLLSRPLRNPASPSASPDANEKKRTTGSFPRHVLTKKSGESWTNRAVLNVWTRTTSFV